MAERVVTLVNPNLQRQNAAWIRYFVARLEITGFACSDYVHLRFSMLGFKGIDYQQQAF